MNKDEQLRIYSAYLPYKLKVYDPNSTIERELTYKGYWYRSSEDDTVYISLDEILECGNKPILFDLSYLTKPIEHEGEKFVPIVELAKIGTREDNCYVTNGNIGTCYVDSKYQKKGFFMYHPDGYFMWQVGKNAEPLTVWDQHKLFQKLYEWHFNVFNIPEGQFINKSTLTNNK